MSLFAEAFSVYRDLPPFSNRGSANDPPKGGAMVIFVAVKLKKLFKKREISVRNIGYRQILNCELKL